MPTLEEMFEQSQHRAVLDEFEHEPVSLTTFVQDRGYLANPPLSMLQYDAVRHAERIYRPDMYPMLAERSSSPEIRAYWQEPALDGHAVRMVNFVTLEWGKGAGKDHICRIISLRIAYLLLCLRSPTDYYTLPEQDTIHLLNVAASSTQANRAFFQPLRQALKRENNWFARNGYAQVQQGEVQYAKGVMAISGHSDAETQEGLNLLLGVADEIDAFKSQSELDSARGGGRPREATTTAEGILKMIRSSARTRFSDTFKNVRISWPRYKGSMIQQLIAQGELSLQEKGQRSPHFISGPYSTWAVNPRVPDRRAFEEDYRDDPIGAAARYECKPQRAVNPYFANQLAVEAAQTTVARQPLIVNYKRGPSAWEPDFDIGADLRPIRGAIYAMHADLAKNGDRAGIAMAHVVRQVEVPTTITAEDGREVQTFMMIPHVKVDFVIAFEADLGLDPPREIQIRWARQLFVILRNRQFNIRSFSFDHYQSLDSMQILEAQYGVKSERMSTDLTDEPWRNLRDLLSEERVTWPENPMVFNELLGLSRLPNRKIDHLTGGSKDMADALACAVMGAVLMGGQEDEGGPTAYIEPDVILPPGALETMLPVGFTDPSMLNPGRLMHAEPVMLDGMGRPVLYSPEDEVIAGPLEDLPEEPYHGG